VKIGKVQCPVDSRPDDEVKIGKVQCPVDSRPDDEVKIGKVQCPTTAHSQQVEISAPPAARVASPIPAAPKIAPSLPTDSIQSSESSLQENPADLPPAARDNLQSPAEGPHLTTLADITSATDAPFLAGQLQVHQANRTRIIPNVNWALCLYRTIEKPAYLDLYHRLLTEHIHERKLVVPEGLPHLARLPFTTFVDGLGSAENNNVVTLLLCDENGNPQAIVYNDAEIDSDISGTGLPAATGAVYQHTLDDESGDHPICVSTTAPELAGPAVLAILQSMASSNMQGAELQAGELCAGPGTDHPSALVLNAAQIGSVGMLTHLKLHKFVLTADQQRALVYHTKTLTLDRCLTEDGGASLVAAIMETGHKFEKLVFTGNCSFDTAELLRLFRHLDSILFAPVTVNFLEGAWSILLDKPGMYDYLFTVLTQAFHTSRKLQFLGVNLDEFYDLEERNHVFDENAGAPIAGNAGGSSVSAALTASTASAATNTSSAAAGNSTAAPVAAPTSKLPAAPKKAASSAGLNDATAAKQPSVPSPDPNGTSNGPAADCGGGINNTELAALGADTWPKVVLEEGNLLVEQQSETTLEFTTTSSKNLEIGVLFKDESCIIELLPTARLQYSRPDGEGFVAKVPIGATDNNKDPWCNTCVGAFKKRRSPCACHNHKLQSE